MLNLDQSIAEAEKSFQDILTYVQGDAQQQALHEVERNIFSSLLKVGLNLLVVFIAKKGTGWIGKEHPGKDGAKLSYKRDRKVAYFSIFGKLDISRAYYYCFGQEGVFPLDKMLQLPERVYSYLLQDWVGQFFVRDTFDSALESLEKFLGFRLPKRSLEQVAQDASRDVEIFHEAQEIPEPETEGKLLVVSVDCKGIPLVEPGNASGKVRLKKGEKRTKKKRATVSALYSIAPQVRSAQDVLREVTEKKESAERVRPQNKKVWASLQGKEKVFQELQRDMKKRNSQERKPVVCLMDGERKLWEWQRIFFPMAICILDLYHVLEYLWKASHVFYPEGTKKAQDWVTEHLRMLLEGKIGYLIGGLEQSLTKRPLRGNKKKTLEGVIGYFKRNQGYMQYDQYLAAGYPIGSGVVEGACRNLVKDRFERTGMRWTIEGAEAVLKLRAIYLNGNWNDFWDFHIHQEQERRFNHRSWEFLNRDKSSSDELVFKEAA